MPRPDDVRSQRVWARVAGLMYWVVLVVDLTGMQLHSPTGRFLSLAGALFTLPLAYGLYYAVRPEGPMVAAGALCCRLIEAGLGLISVVVGFAGVKTQLSAMAVGPALFRLAEWDDSTNFAAFAFTVGSTLFFYLFVRSGSIPRVLSWWGLLASVLALSACAAHLFRPAFPAMTMYAWIPMLLAETSTGTWLLFKSVKVKFEASHRATVSSLRWE